MTAITVNGNTYSDDGTTSKDLGNGGFRTHLMAMLKDSVADLEAKRVAANTAKQQAETAASSAANAPGTSATSGSNIPIAMGARGFYLAESGKLFQIGQTVVLASRANRNNWMAGPIDSFDAATRLMNVNFTNVNGAVGSSFNDWTVSLSGPAGVTGVLNELRGADVAVNAGVLNLMNTTGNTVDVTSSANISTIQLPHGAKRHLIMAVAGGAFISSGSLVVPGGANYTWAYADVVEVMGDGVNGCRILSITRYDGRAMKEWPLASETDTRNGSSASHVVTPDALKKAIGFSAYMQTADQSVTGGGTLTIAHGFSRAPTFIEAYLRVTTAGAGYNVGDILFISIGVSQFFDTGNSYAMGCTVRADSTNLYVTFANGYGSYVFPAANGNSVLTLDNAKIKLILKAFA